MPTAFVIHSRRRATIADTSGRRMRDAVALPGQPLADAHDDAAAVIAGATRVAASLSACSDSAKALRNRRSFRHGREVPRVAG